MRPLLYWIRPPLYEWSGSLKSQPSSCVGGTSCVACRRASGYDSPAWRPSAPRQPTEDVVEAAVLHHHDDDVLDARTFGMAAVRANGPRLSVRDRRQTGATELAAENRDARRPEGSFDEFTSTEVHSCLLKSRWSPAPPVRGPHHRQACAGSPDLLRAFVEPPYSEYGGRGPGGAVVAAGMCSCASEFEFRRSLRCGTIALSSIALSCSVGAGARRHRR